MTAKNLRERFAEFFRGRNEPPVITENSSLQEIAIHYPRLFDFLERKYGVKTEVGEKALSLREFVDAHDLPPAQIVFMEVQMGVRTEGVRELTPREAKRLWDKTPTLKVLDVREDWEMKLCRLARSEPMSTTILDQILTEWPKDKPILLFCHFGIRSLDAATFLVDRGFTEIYILKGGIDAWSQEIDPKIPRYENAWC
jgi:rhodanese-related sulfurtransferase